MQAVCLLGKAARRAQSHPHASDSCGATHGPSQPGAGPALHATSVASSLRTRAPCICMCKGSICGSTGYLSRER